VNLFRTLDDFPDQLRGGAVAIGNFDGVHLGHARLLERLRLMAERVGGPAVVLTFDPPPARVLRPQDAPEPLLWVDRKLEILAELGVDATVLCRTTRNFLEMDARAFFDDVICCRFGARAIVEGPNFFFGHNRSGTVEVLRRFCDEAGLPFEVTQPVEVANTIVSSSRIRALVLAARVEEARSMLGRPYRIRGVVVRGAGRGAGLGYPTANLGHIDTLMPGEGIFAAAARVENAWHPAAVSVGPNPTFADRALKIETHLIGFRGQLYDQGVEVDFFARLRDIQQFASIQELVTQMARDVARTREIVGT
jgi:riboflavin kinase / FMN adenylyltransferase